MVTLKFSFKRDRTFSNQIKVRFGNNIPRRNENYILGTEATIQCVSLGKSVCFCNKSVVWWRGWEKQVGEEGGGGSKDLLPLTTPLRTPSSSWTQSEARLNGRITVKELGYEVFIPGWSWELCLEGKNGSVTLEVGKQIPAMSWSQNTFSLNQSNVFRQNKTLTLRAMEGKGRLTEVEHKPPWKGESVTWQNVKSAWN